MLRQNANHEQEQPMATITAGTKLVIDEQIGVQPAPDNDVTLSPTLISELQGLGVAGIPAGGTDATTGFPQVAVNTALLDTTGVTDLALSVPVDGESSGLFTVNNVEIFLYNQGGVIYGREADTSGNPDPAGALVFAVALDKSDLSSAQIYLIQYEPLRHNDPLAIDGNDILSLANGKITLDVSTTEFVTTFQSLDFAAIPSGSPQETLTVATTDPTDNHNAFFDGIIFPTGAVSDPTTLNKNPGTNDDLNPDAIGFGVKGGQASQLNQNEGFLVQDAAWTSSDPDANEIGGIRFDIQGVGGVKTVNIEWWTVDNGTIVDHGTDKVTLPSGNAIFPNYTIQPADSVDQIYVRFTYDTKLDTSGVRVENLKVAFPSTTEVTVTNHEDLGTHLVFEDAGPTITVGDITNGTYAAVASSAWSEAPGADGFKSLNITLNDYTIDSHAAVTVNTSLGTVTTADANGNYVFNGSITADFTDDGIANNQTVTFKLTFDPDDGTPADGGTYTFEVTSVPSSTTTISTANGSLDAGGPDPVRTLTIGTQAIVFSAVKATASVADIEGNLDKTEAQIQTNPLPGYISPAQMNVSTAGIGLANNNFDGNATAGVDGGTTQGGAFDESFVVDPTNFLVSGMKVFIDNSVGGYNPSTEGLFYRIYYDDGSVSSTTKVNATDLTPAAGGQVTFQITSAHNANDIDAVQLFMGSGTVKIPVIEFNISQTFAAQSLAMNFTATLADGDSDTHQDAFKVAIA
jgi:hypothetical protein